MRNKMFLFLVLTFVVMLNSNAQDQNSLSRYHLKPEIGIRLAPGFKSDFLGIGGNAGLFVDNPVKKLGLGVRLDYGTAIYWGKQNDGNDRNSSIASLVATYKLFYTVNDEPLKLGAEALFTYRGFFNQIEATYQFGISLIQEYHDFNIELAWLGFVSYESQVYKYWRIGALNTTLHFIVSYSFDFSKDH